MLRYLVLIAFVAATCSPVFAQREFGFDNRKASGQEYLTPEESVKRMKVPPEFEVKLFAGEPKLVNPVAFTIDEKGRVWVVECFEYPGRTPKGKAPRDRIVILEDTDGDGLCDKRTIFAEGKDFPVTEARKKAGLGAFDLCTGIEVGHGGVYVGAPPYLWFIENKNDKPGKFETLLSGFGSQDTHETLNTFQWGPDGWLYGLHGVFTQSVVKPLDGPATRMNAAVWRFHPKTRKFEIFAEGTSNPWGMDWRNTDGQFILACCVIPHLYHIVPGGIYKRQAGSSENPYAYGYINEICDHTFHKESGWAHAGLISLDVPHIPEKYRNSVIFGSIHGCSIKQNILKPKGSSFTASRGDDFLVSGDKNFRPINMKWGPHGDIYIIDWHDQNPCHQAAAGSWDYERGRIYRIQLKDRKGGKVEDLGKKTDKELAVLAAKQDPYTYRQALRVLSSRNVENARALIYADFARASTPLSFVKLMAIIQAIDPDGEKEKVSDLQSNPDQPLPEQGDVIIRAMLDSEHVTARTMPGLTKLASYEKQSTVRRELASAAIRYAEIHDARPLLHELMKHKEDAGDPLIPHLVWIAYEKVIASPKTRLVDELAFLATESPDNSFVRDGIVPKVMRRLVATGKAETLALCLKFLGDVKDVNTREKALEGLTTALAGRTAAPPQSWPALQAELRQEPRLVPLLNKLGVSFRDPAAAKQALEAAVSGATPETRIEGLRDLVHLQHPEAAVVVLRILRDKNLSAPLRQEAARHLAAFSDPKLPGSIINDWAAFPREIQVEIIGSLASRKDSAKALLQAMKDNQIDRLLVTDNTIIKMQAFQDKDINALIETAWGRTRPTPDELTKLIDKTRAALGDTPASFARGRLIFENQCAKCHKFDGKGVEVGPALDGAGRDIEYLLANIIDPNRVIGAPYFLRTVTTLDGRVEQGLLVEEDTNSITLKVENALLKKFPKKELDGPVKVQEKSMMPEGLTAGMTPQNFRDLLRYLMAHPFIADVVVSGKALSVGVPGRIPLPAGKDIVIEASFTAREATRTKLLVGAAAAFTIQIDGKAVGKGMGQNARPDSDSFDVDLAKGKHTLTITVSEAAAGHALYARFLDPNRILRYADE